ncbi:hypothetical protein SO802_022719, partial [Lithocarpus litseifolius]
KLIINVFFEWKLLGFKWAYGPKCPFFKWLDNPTCMCGNEAAHLVQQKLDLLRSELQLAHERKRAAT